MIVLLIAASSSVASCAQGRAEKVIGAALPESATDIRVAHQGGLFGGDSFVSARMSRADFEKMVSGLCLRNRPDLLQYWLTALRGADIEWWDVSDTNDQDTYFGDCDESTYLVVRFENERMFFKRHVY